MRRSVWRWCCGGWSCGTVPPFVACLAHRLAQEVHSERLEHLAEEEPGRGMASGGLEHDLHRPRDLDLTLNAPPDRAPELCAHGQHRKCGVCSGPWTSRPPGEPTSVTRGGLRSIGHSAYGFMTVIAVEWV